MRYPVSRIPLRAVLITLAAFLWLLISAATTSTLYAEVIVTTPPDPIHLPTVGDVETPLDVDGDGSTDFIFGRPARWTMHLEPATAGRIVVAPTYGYDPEVHGCPISNSPAYSFSGDRVTPLPGQFLIGPILPLSGIHWAGRTVISHISECWPDAGHYGLFRQLGGYIGIEFPIHGAAHYGWIRFDHFDFTPGGSILEWAFESVPAVPIRTPNNAIVVPIAAPKLTPGGLLRLEWDGRPGMVYQVQAKPRIDAPTWTDVSSIIPIAGLYTTFHLPITAPTQFFRVILAATPVPVPWYWPSPPVLDLCEQPHPARMTPPFQPPTTHP